MWIPFETIYHPYIICLIASYYDNPLLLIFYILFTGEETSEGARMVATVAEIVCQLIDSHKKGKDVNLNK